MHYTSDEQLSENILKLVIYIHTEGGASDELEVQVASIQECRYFSPSTLQKILMVPDFFINARDYKPEEWILVTIKDLGYDSVRIESVECVSESNNEFHRLH